MNIKQNLDEDSIIALAARLFSQNRQNKQNLEKDLRGIGDDCAVIPWKNKKSLLVTSDMLVEGTHFLLSSTKANDLGQKALAVNLSDIAAMGGTPSYVFLSWGLPSPANSKWVNKKWVQEFLTGFAQLAQLHNVTLLGGDTVFSSEALVINITLLGTANSKNIKLRSAAKIGDLICVSGYLGDSAAGLKLISDKTLTGLDKRLKKQISPKLIKKHISPRAQVKEGQWLGGQNGVHAMMDLSDGLNCDILKINQQSRCGAQINLDRLPISPELRELGNKCHWNLQELAAVGGEDYGLLLTVSPNQFARLSQRFQSLFNIPLTAVGKVIPLKKGQSNALIYEKANKVIKLKERSWNHF